MKKNYFKTSLLFLFIFLSALSHFAQDFVWMKGSNMADVQASYGQIGVAAAANNPGAREGAASWTDANGNFWLFGGYGYDATSGVPGYLNDLWKYNTQTNEWTWVKGGNVINQYGVYGTMGTAALANMPGSRGYTGFWLDVTGNLWLFGGRGFSSGGGLAELNDLWRYNPSNNQWTWMNGSLGGSQFGVYGTLGLGAPANTPGARKAPVSWTDNAGNLWLHGGNGFGTNSSGDLNDLWRYNVVNEVWTWIRGTGQINQYGTYGTMGTSSPTLNPGARSFGSGWTDAFGNLWLFGGLGRAASGPQDILGDLWTYDIISNHWTWVKGYNTVTTQQGVYGSPGVFNAANLPGSRYGSLTWRDGTGDLWLFSGIGFDGGFTSDNLNDLWRYDISTNEWMWYKGSGNIGQAGIYGTQGIPTSFNVPGARTYASGWMDSSNNLWIFGGQGNDYQDNTGDLNDVWKLYNCIGPTLTITSTGPGYLCAGQPATLTATGANTYTWNFNQTAAPSIVVSPQGSSSYSVFGVDINGCGDTLEFIQIVVNPPILTVQNQALEVCPGQPTNIQVSGAVTYTWSTTDNTAIISVTPAITSTYTVIGTDANGCTTEATATQSVGCVGIRDNGPTGNYISVYPNPNNGEFTIHADGIADKTTFVLLNTLGQKIMNADLRDVDTLIHLNVPGGIYYYTVLQSGQKTDSGKLVIH